MTSLPVTAVLLLLTLLTRDPRAGADVGRALPLTVIVQVAANKFPAWGPNMSVGNDEQVL